MTRNSVSSVWRVRRIPREPNTFMRHDRTHPTGPDNAAAGVVGTAATRLSGETKLHSHSRHQFIYSVKGVMDFITPEGRWILPPSRALWIGAGLEHALRVKRPVDMHILYIDRTSKGVPAWPGCAVVNVTPLVRELVAACVTFPWDYPEDSPNARLATVLLEQISTLDHAPVQLREPKDPRARRVLNMLRAEVDAGRLSNKWLLKPLRALALLNGSFCRKQAFPSASGDSVTGSFRPWSNWSRMCRSRSYPARWAMKILQVSLPHSRSCLAPRRATISDKTR